MRKKMYISLLFAILLVAIVVTVIVIAMNRRHDHELVYHEAIDATCTTGGNLEYWECTDCHELFADEQMTSTLEQIPTTVALGHDFNNDMYECSRCDLIAATSTLEFSVSDDLLSGSYALSGTDANDSVIVIPKEYNNCPITRFSSNAVAEGITRIVIPANDNLYFESNAFSSSVQEIYFRGSVDDWAEYYFESNWIANSNHSLYVESEDGTSWEKVDNLYLSISHVSDYSFYGFDITSVALATTVERVDSYAFAGCGKLISADLANLNLLAAYTFYGCTSLNMVVLSENMTEIAISTFAFCSSLDNLYIPIGITRIRTNAFAGCDAMTNLMYEGSEEQWLNVTIDGIGNDILSTIDIIYNS